LLGLQLLCWRVRHTLTHCRQAQLQAIDQGRRPPRAAGGLVQALRLAVQLTQHRALKAQLQVLGSVKQLLQGHGT
jgi:hypothetical protein